MKDIRFVTNGSKTEVYSPYNKDFIDQIKTKIGSRKYDPSKKCWTVNTSDLDLVKEIIRNVYGYDDTDTEMVNVKMTFPDGVTVTRDAVRLNGWILAKAESKRSGAVPGKDVTVLDGKLSSGGSVNQWETIIEPGTVLKVKMPKTLAENKNAKLNTDFEYDEDSYTLEIIEDEVIDKEALEEEKAKLLARLEEINKLLNQK